MYNRQVKIALMLLAATVLMSAASFASAPGSERLLLGAGGV